MLGRERLEQVLSTLDKEEERVIRLLYLENMSLEDVAFETWMTGYKVASILRQAFKKLRHPIRLYPLEGFLEALIAIPDAPPVYSDFARYR